MHNHRLRRCPERRIGGYPALLYPLYAIQTYEDTLRTPMAPAPKTYARNLNHLR
nr:hypothetical protein [Lewinella sp. IMCC34191]